ncbi:MAG: pentapeptide repeat-containing protein [Anaerolineae bacterium]|nr:pentapeptide repeat-containing protein [Anaerolineae bacterium]
MFTTKAAMVALCLGAAVAVLVGCGGPAQTPTSEPIPEPISAPPAGCPPNCFMADLHRSALRETDLRGANLREANLREADLSEADLSGADLRDANLRDANLRGADLRDANLRGAALIGTKLDDNTQIDDKWRLVWGDYQPGAAGRDLRKADLREGLLVREPICTGPT